MPWLRVISRHGKDYYQVVYDYSVRGKEYQLGTEQYIEISDAEAALTLDKLARLYRAEKAEATAAKQGKTSG